MYLTYYSNSLNHHQVSLASELSTLLGGDFRFVITKSMSTCDMKGGVDYRSLPYCLEAEKSQCHEAESYRLARESEVCVFGANSQKYAVERARFGEKLLSFEMSERWLKKGWINVFSPNCMKWWLNYMRFYRKSNFYKLCMSAFAAADDERMGCYKGKHYKWGYFTAVESIAPRVEFSANSPIHMLWCGRFIDWKHPELAIHMAANLKKQGYDFVLNMIGDGKEKPFMEALSKRLGVEDVVRFLGPLPNHQVVEKMKESDVFLFTSDKNEGWGAVANEAMGQGCAVVASDAIGSVPYLIKDGVNGLRFKSGDIVSLTAKVQWLMEYREEMSMMRKEAYKTISEVWSPKTAAKNLLQLINDLKEGNEPSIVEGPGSIA